MERARRGQDTRNTMEGTGGMADSVYQFGALKVLDEFFGTGDDRERDRRYDLAIERLQQEDFDLLGDTVAGIERAHLAHLDEHWLPDRGAGYWRDRSWGAS